MSGSIVITLLLTSLLGQDYYPHLKRTPGFDLPVSKEPPGLPGPELWQSGPYCGANCIYIVLRLCGRPVSHEDVRRQLPTEGRGASMLDMARVLDSERLPSKIVRVGPGTLAREPMPLIARLEPRGPESGHFVVIYGVNPHNGQLEVMDGTSGTFGSVAPEQFDRDFSGEAIVPTRTDWSRLAVAASKTCLAIELVLGLGLGAAMLWVSRRGRRTGAVSLRAP